MRTTLRVLAVTAGFAAVVAVCGVATWWQVHRAESGNVLSYGYAVEWPLIAVGAAVMWWQALHRRAPDVTAPPAPPPGAPAPVWEEGDAALQAYNAELRRLAGGTRKTWRNPHGW